MVTACFILSFVCMFLICLYVSKAIGIIRICNSDKKNTQLNVIKYLKVFGNSFDMSWATA